MAIHSRTLVFSDRTGRDESKTKQQIMYDVDGVHIKSTCAVPVLNYNDHYNMFLHVDSINFASTHFHSPSLLTPLPSHLSSSN